jgi:ferredoxin-NADP reductase
MLQYISEESILVTGTRLELHYIIRNRDDALFLTTIEKLKSQLGDEFEAHLWITRLQPESDKDVPLPKYIAVHQGFASQPEEIGKSWHWWVPFTNRALERFINTQTKDEGMTYICGPQGLTDKLVSLYEEQDMHIDDGHVQIEKWW